MIIPEFLGETDKPFIYADCAVNIDPTAEQLADIAIASAESAKKILGEEPRVAMLSFSTRGSASSASVDKVKMATEIAKNKRSYNQQEHYDAGGYEINAAACTTCHNRRNPTAGANFVFDYETVFGCR